MGYAIKRYHGSYNISPRDEAVRYIVVHYVGSGTSAPGSARANCQFFAGGNRNSSAHYFLDDAYIYEYADPASYATWHCGDGHGRYGITNANSVGIEVCINGDVPYTAAEVERLTWLVGQLMERFGVPPERVVRHYDASRKACPYFYTPYGSGGDAAWDELHATITEGDIVTDADIQKIAEAVWNFSQNGVLCRDRLQGTDEAANEARRQLTRTDDCSDRPDPQRLCLHDHVKWMAAKQRSMGEEQRAQGERLESVEDKLDALLARLG